MKYVRAPKLALLLRAMVIGGIYVFTLLSNSDLKGNLVPCVLTYTKWTVQQKC
jgi:hypothetical protein